MLGKYLNRSVSEQRPSWDMRGRARLYSLLSSLISAMLITAKAHCSGRSSTAEISPYPKAEALAGFEVYSTPTFFLAMFRGDGAQVWFST